MYVVQFLYLLVPIARRTHSQALDNINAIYSALKTSCGTLDDILNIRISGANLDLASI